MGRREDRLKRLAEAKLREVKHWTQQIVEPKKMGETPPLRKGFKDYWRIDDAG